MTRAESRAIRLVRLIVLLDAHRSYGLSVEEIANRLGVSYRQVFRDLDGVERIGIPLITEERGRYRILDAYTLPRILEQTR